MKLLAIDASTHSTGYAFGSDGKFKQYGCLTTNSDNVLIRITAIRDQIVNIIKNNNINKIFLEEVYPEYNSHTNKILTWLQAAIIIGAFEANTQIEYQLINPSEWRAILGIKQGPGIDRETLKQEDIEYVKNKYQISSINDDEADALCIFDAYWKKNNNEINWE